MTHSGNVASVFTHEYFGHVNGTPNGKFTFREPGAYTVQKKSSNIQ
ncbi:hypothetical protein GYB57_00835 [bacterium]|nr:hypothetical protein [bacterium]